MYDIEKRAKEYQEFESWPDFLDSIDHNKSWDMVRLICDQAKELKELQERYDALVKDEWQPIETMPRDIDIDTYGEFMPVHSDKILLIRNPNDWVSSNTPYPLVKTYFSYNDMSGRYTRTHWKYPATPPKKD